MEPIIQSKQIDNLENIACKLYETELKRHNDAGHPLNVLLFLVDNGFHKRKRS